MKKNKLFIKILKYFLLFIFIIIIIFISNNYYNKYYDIIEVKKENEEIITLKENEVFYGNKFNTLVLLKEIEEVSCWYECINTWYTKSWSTYNIWADIWKYQLNINDKDIIIYNTNENYYSDDLESYISISDENWNEIKYNWFYFKAWMYSLTEIIEVQNWDLIFTNTWHEWPKWYLYYSNKNNKFLNIWTLLSENINNPNRYFDLILNENQILIESLDIRPYSIWSTYYNVVIDIETLEITNLELLLDRDYWTEKNWCESYDWKWLEEYSSCDIITEERCEYYWWKYLTCESSNDDATESCIEYCSFK